MNFNTARKNMLLNQIRTWDFISPENISIMQKIQREEFVPVEHRKLAFSDIEIPLPHNEQMMKPILEGRILQSLGLTGNEKVLEIGTGSAYMTALLALSSDHVTSIDIHQDFIDSATEKLNEAQINNVKCEQQDVFNLHSTYKFDCIVATGSFESIPTFLLQNIKHDGKIFAIVGKQPIMSAMILSKEEGNDYKIETLFETCVQTLHKKGKKVTFKL
ncbi:MAG TPA: protein-L-isoaspartate O-methyltransferase, partial [Oceanospirillales bacterium]|nr:protein-L-isoaspartate O-methyltransferase [Oceanospirillales bacterium]